MQSLSRAPALALALLTSVSALAAAPHTDPLPSWSDAAPKRAILAFVHAATQEEGPGYLPPAERIAVFDVDGTLLPEQPLMQGAFVLSRLKALADKDPALRQRPAVRAALERDVAYFEKEGPRAVLELMTQTETGLTDEQYETQVRQFLKGVKHPRLGVPFPQTAYVPMLELLEFLRASGFQTWLCSGGSVDFLRVLSPQLFGIPREQVIGSSLKKEAREQGGSLVLVRTDQLLTLNDQAQKPVNLSLHLGQRPALAVGNVRSAGDVQMLTYSKGRKGPSLQLLLNHDDAEREFAYAEKDGASLAAAKSRGFTVVSMKRDWKSVFDVGTRLVGDGPAAFPEPKTAPSPKR